MHLAPHAFLAFLDREDLEEVRLMMTSGPSFAVSTPGALLAAAAATAAGTVAAVAAEPSCPSGSSLPSGNSCPSGSSASQAQQQGNNEMLEQHSRNLMHLYSAVATLEPGSIFYHK